MFAIFPEPMYYSWGNSSLVNQFFLLNIPESLSLAELWMGSHTKAPSRILDPRTMEPQDTNLLTLIEEFPEYLLGSDWNTPDGKPSLPFLFKILSASQALSIQAHPSLEQAKDGFDRENKLGIPIDAPHRNYRDSNHKPESITALGDFYALRGFRSPENIRHFFEPIKDRFKSVYDSLLIEQESKALKSFVEKIFRLDKRDLNQLLTKLEKLAQSEVAALSKDQSEHLSEEYLISPYRWFLRLLADFPGDPGCLGPFYLNIFHLKPGQSMVLRAGELHAYLDGIGIELMANSDNVLRAGCTPKHIDLAELLHVTMFEVNKDQIIDVAVNHWIDGGNKEFKLFWGNQTSNQQQSLSPSPRPRIVLCLSHGISLEYVNDNEQVKKTGFKVLERLRLFTSTLSLKPGQSVFIPPHTPGIVVSGEGSFAIAAVGEDGSNH
jgi:mannose-6-phosphate isomerase